MSKRSDRPEEQLPLLLVRELPATPQNLIYFGKAYRELMQRRKVKKCRA